MVRGITLFCLLLGAAVGFKGAAHAEPAPTVHIVNSANNALAITTIEPQISWPLVLQRSDTEVAAATVQIDVTHLMSVSGRPQQVALQNKDGAAHDGNLTLPARGQETLRVVARVPEEGAYKGEIGIVVGGKRTPIVFTVTRTVRDVVVMGAAGGALQVTTPDPALQWPIVIRRNDNAEGPRNVGVELSSLIAPSGQAVALELRNGNTPVTAVTPISLEPLGQATLNLIGKLTEEGIYNGEIGLVVDGKRLSTVLKITRSLKDSAVRIEDVAQVHTTIDPAGIDMRLRLQETEGQETTVDVPTLVKLDRKEGSALIQANNTTLNVLLNGQSLTNILVLGPRKTLDLALKLQGLTTPGNYAGVLRISSPARKASDKAFELSLRRGIGCAIILILAGVLLSTAARAYYTFGRSAILAQGNAITLRDDLLRFQTITPDLTVDEKRVLSHLLDRLDAVRRGNANTDLGKPDIQVAEIRRKADLLFRWIDLRRKLDAVEPRRLGNAVRAEHGRILIILDKDGATEVETNQALASLQTYASNLDTAVKDELKRAITELQNAIATLTSGQMLALEDTSAALVSALGDAELGNHEAAAERLTAARHAYVQVAIKELKDNLDPGKRAPGFTPQAWTDLVAEYNQRLNSILAMSDAEQKVREWNRLRINWLHAIAEALLRQVEADNQVATNTAAPAAPPPDAPDPVTAKANYAKARTALESIDGLLLARKFQDASKAYKDAVDAYADGREAMKQAIQLSGPGAPQAPAPTDGGEVPDTVIQGAWNAITFALRAPVTAVQANNRVLIAEGLLSVLMLALALVVGLKFLYFDNAAWGAPIDLCVAFLWGFGLHQFGGTAFQGVQSIAQQIVGK